MKRRIHVLPTHMHDRIVAFMGENDLPSEVDAVRRLLAYALDRHETAEALAHRLASLPTGEAMREACGHPLVTKIEMGASVEIEFTNGDSLQLEAPA